MPRHDAPDSRRRPWHPDVKPQMTGADAAWEATKADRAWRKLRRVTERTPAVRSSRRDSRAARAVALLRLRMFWEGLAEDYPGRTRLLDGLPPRHPDGEAELRQRWVQTEAAVREAAERGTLR